MLLRSNNAFRCLGITVPAARLLAIRSISIYAENSRAKKVLAFNSSHRVLSRFENIDKECKYSHLRDDLSMEPHSEKFPVFTTREVDKATRLEQRINKDRKTDCINRRKNG